MEEEENDAKHPPARNKVGLQTKMAEKMIIYTATRDCSSRCSSQNVTMDVRKWMCTGKVKCLLIYQWLWYLLWGRWTECPPKLDIDCHPVFIVGTTTAWLPLFCEQGKTGGRIGRMCHEKKEYESSKYLFLLVLALGAMSGVRTYRLLFLGKCKLLSSVWSSRNVATQKVQC